MSGVALLARYIGKPLNLGTSPNTTGFSLLYSKRHGDTASRFTPDHFHQDRKASHTLSIFDTFKISLYFISLPQSRQQDSAIHIVTHG
jgi:hypothetical protein